MNIIKYYTIRQASDILGIKVRTVREWIRTGRIDAVKLGGSNRWFISHNEIERLTSGKDSE